LAKASVVLIEPLGNSAQCGGKDALFETFTCRRVIFQEKTKVFAFGLPFPQETDTPTLRDSIRTLLGPKPQVKTIFEPAESGAPNNIDIQKSALIAYRAKVVALMNILEGNVTAPARDPIAQVPQHKMGGLHKPVAAARSARPRKQTAA
jgi:hypothetical protein